MQHHQKKRNRFTYTLLIVGVIFLGLWMRRQPDFFPNFIATYAPDALWALMVFLLLGFVFAEKNTPKCCKVEYCTDFKTHTHTKKVGRMIIVRGFQW